MIYEFEKIGTFSVSNEMDYVLATERFMGFALLQALWQKLQMGKRFAVAICKVVLKIDFTFFYSFSNTIFGDHFS